MHARVPLLLALCAALSTPAAGAEPAVELTVKGSDTIGQRLGQDLARAYMQRRPDVRVRWESIGSGTAFTGLLEGSADLGASSRAIKPSELEQAGELALRLQEFVIGYDGIAVIAHPSNPVEALGLDQLAGLFAGDLARWSDVGGADRPVRLISRPSYSGTHGFFKDTVLATHGKADFSAATEFVEETDAIVQAVTQDPDAISYVGLGFVSGRPLRVLRIRSQAGGEAVAPSEATIRDGTYAIHRPLFVYVRDNAARPAFELLEFILSADARTYIAQNQFIATDVATPLVQVRDATPDVAAPPGVALERRGVRAVSRAPVRIRFPFNRVQLGPNGRAALEPLVARLARGEIRAHIIGHSDALGSRVANTAVSSARARGVATYLMSRGVPAEQLRIEARASEQPVASNDSPEGRSANRRVDILVTAR